MCLSKEDIQMFLCKTCSYIALDLKNKHKNRSLKNLENSHKYL